MTLSYLKAFQEIQSNAELKLVGDLLLVELIKEEEVKTKSGLILSSSTASKQINGLSADKPTFARILAVGEGYYDDSSPSESGLFDEEPRSVPLESQPGQIILIATHSFKPFSVFGKLTSYGEVELGLTREADVQARFESQETFDSYFKRLNASVGGIVEAFKREMGARTPE